MESSVEVKRNSQKKDYQQQGCEDSAVLVELGDITDFLCFHLYAFHLDGVGADGLAVAPTGVPLLQIDGIGTDADKNAVVEIDAVAVGVGGGVVTG